MALTSIVFVCTGNTCRSVMAEILLRRMLEKEGLRGLQVFSRGVAALNGQPASLGTQEALEAVGLDARAHQSGRLTAQDIQQADWILVMEDFHRQVIVNQAPEAVKKTFLLKELAGAGGEESRDIKDPIGSSNENYARTRDEIQDALLGLFSKIKSQVPSPFEGEG